MEAKASDIIYEWKKLVSTEGSEYPISREGHSLTYSPFLKKLVMFGGMNSSRLNDLYTYDVERNRWASLSSKGRQPSPRCYHSTFVDERHLFIFFGQGDKGRSQSDLFCLLKDSMTWKKLFLLESLTARHQTAVAANIESRIIREISLHLRRGLFSIRNDPKRPMDRGLL